MENKLKNEDCKYNFKGICCVCEAPAAGMSCCLGIKNCDVYLGDEKEKENE